MSEKFIRVRGTGDVYHFTEALATRDDIDVVEAPEGSTPETVAAAFNNVAKALKDEATAVALAAEKELAKSQKRQAEAVAKALKTEAEKPKEVPPAEVVVVG